MVFVVDDRAGWLVGLLADAGRKKLTTLVLGDAQERALQQAANAAVQGTASELSPSDGQRAGQIAMLISEVFRAPVPDAPLAGVATLAEGLQAGIAGQLAVLDDADLTAVCRWLRHGCGTRKPLAWELVCHVSVTSLPQVSRHRSLSGSSSQVRHETMMITSATLQAPDPTCRRILHRSCP